MNIKESERNKRNETIIQDFWEMIRNSWTYNKMTKEEQETLQELLDHNITRKAQKGTKGQQWEILNAIYWAYLKGIGYNNANWRDKTA